MLKDLIIKNRSYRRFHQEKQIPVEILKEFVNIARLCPSAANFQPLKYILSNEPEKNETIFQTLAWAGYLKDWPGPKKGEQPTAYIIILGDNEIAKSFDTDCGIAAQSILLAAAEKGIGGCMVGSIKREKLQKDLNIPDRYKIVLVIALGYPSEKVQLETAKKTDDIKYYRDSQDVHHVPKRPLDEIILD